MERKLAREGGSHLPLFKPVFFVLLIIKLLFLRVDLVWFGFCLLFLCQGPIWQTWVLSEYVPFPRETERGQAVQ
jgi:hypothetical protein